MKNKEHRMKRRKKKKALTSWDVRKAKAEVPALWMIRFTLSRQQRDISKPSFISLPTLSRPCFVFFVLFSPYIIIPQNTERVVQGETIKQRCKHLVFKLASLIPLMYKCLWNSVASLTGSSKKKKSPAFVPNRKKNIDHYRFDIFINVKPVVTTIRICN